jgi:hypothetical protein
MCEYLHAEQCPWSELESDEAAKNDQVHTLRWLHEHGCPWDCDSVCMRAAASGSVEVLEYLQQHDLMSTPKLLTRMLNTAGAYKKLAAAQWLRQQGAGWPRVLCWEWSQEMLAWAEAEGCTSPVEF